jgi:hypothetical protein
VYCQLPEDVVRALLATQAWEVRKDVGGAYRLWLAALRCSGPNGLLTNGQNLILGHIKCVVFVTAL